MLSHISPWNSDPQFFFLSPLSAVCWCIYEAGYIPSAVCKQSYFLRLERANILFFAASCCFLHSFPLNLFVPHFANPRTFFLSCVCMSVWERERQIERERDCVRVCVSVAVCVRLVLSVIAQCEMTRGTRQSAERTRLPGNEKWCWCQRRNRPNHPWAQLHNSNIFFFCHSPFGFPTPPLLSVIAALSSGASPPPTSTPFPYPPISLARSQFKQIWFLLLCVPVTPPLLGELCAGIGTGIKSRVVVEGAWQVEGGRRRGFVWRSGRRLFFLFVLFSLNRLRIFPGPVLCCVSISSPSQFSGKIRTATAQRTQTVWMGVLSLSIDLVRKTESWSVTLKYMMQKNNMRFAHKGNTS